MESHRLGLLATLRRDGSPRISPIEPLFARGELWLGMMTGSRKVGDIRRDARLAIHGATIDPSNAEGDAKISGRGLPVDDQASIDGFLAAFESATGYPPPPGPFALFRVDVKEISTVRPVGDHLVIEWWREGGPVRRVDRR